MLSTGRHLGRRRKTGEHPGTTAPPNRGRADARHDAPAAGRACGPSLPGRRVWLEYTDCTAGEVDLTLLLRGPLFAAVRDDDTLFAQVFVDEAGTLAWPDGADLAPEVLHETAAPHLQVTA